MSPAPSAKAPFSHPDPETPPLKVEVDPGLVEPAADPTVGRLADTRTTANSRLAAESASPRGGIFWFFNFQTAGEEGGPFFSFLGSSRGGRALSRRRALCSRPTSACVVSTLWIRGDTTTPTTRTADLITPSASAPRRDGARDQKYASSAPVEKNEPHFGFA